jgi:hypothetical protein
MESTYYFAAWTECGCLLGCEHKHKTVTEAVNCIPRAGGYLVAVQNGLHRALNGQEEREYWHARRKSLQAAALEYGPSGYAVMTRVRVGDVWTWTTWLHCETFEDAVTRARAEDMVVRFGSARWNALLQNREPLSPAPEVTSAEAQVPRRQGESLVEYVSRVVPSPCLARETTTANFLAPPITNEVSRRTFIEFVLDWLAEWEERLSEKVHFLRILIVTLTLALRRRARKTFSKIPPCR